VPFQAIATLVARHMVRNENSIANTILGDFATSFFNDACSFMTQDDGRFRQPIPFRYVTPTDATRYNLQQKLVFAYFGLGYLLDSYVFVVVIHSRKHQGHPERPRALRFTCFDLLVKLVGFLRRVPIMHYSSDSPDCGQRMFRLPNISA